MLNDDDKSSSNALLKTGKLFQSKLISLKQNCPWVGWTLVGRVSTSGVFSFSLILSRFPNLFLSSNTAHIDCFSIFNLHDN